MEPTIVVRTAQPYLARRESVTMTDFARVADHFPAMFAGLAQRGTAVTGAPFFRYREIDMAAELVVEAGIPVSGPVEAEWPDSSTRCPPVATRRPPMSVIPTS